MKTYLITGGAGFIGSWLVRELLDRGHKIIVIDDLSSGVFKNIDGLAQVEFIQASILDDLESLVHWHNLDGVFHLAAKGDVQESIDNPLLYTQVNIVGTQAILELCRKYSIKFLMTSTCMVYGLNNLELLKEGISETHPATPISPYGASKLSAEQLAWSYYHAYGLDVKIARPFNTYGPHQKVDNKEGGVIPIFLQRKINGERFTVYGSGKQRRDFLYVKDCAKFLADFFFCENNVRLLNAGSGKSISIIELAGLVSQDSSLIDFANHPHPQSEVMELLCNSNLATKTLGWFPKYSLQEGLQENLDWLSKEHLS